MPIASSAATPITEASVSRKWKELGTPIRRELAWAAGCWGILRADAIEWHWIGDHTEYDRLT
jgi:hypothetical protein